MSVKHCVVAVRKGLYLLRKSCLSYAFLNFVPVSSVYALRYVQCNASGENHKLLEHGGKEFIVVFSVVLANVCAVEQHSSLGGVVEAAD